MNKIVKYCTAIHVPYQSLNRCHWWRWQWNGISPFCSTWFHLWFSYRFMLFCYLCLLISCNSVFGFWVLLDCMVCLYFAVIWGEKKEGCKLVIISVLFQW